jgi:hypothetical protein
MIQTEPVMTRKTISTPKAVVVRASTRLAMGESARGVALYNRAYCLAWQELPERTRPLPSRITALLVRRDTKTLETR